MNKATFKRAFISSLPVMAGYTFMGMGFGVLLSAKGYSIWWATLMGITILSGSMQYVAVELLAACVNPFYAALVTLSVNARYFFYSISLVDLYRDMGWRKPYAIFGITDETYSLVCTNQYFPAPIDRRNFDFLLTVMNHSYWIIGCTLGGIIGNTVTFNSKGIDFSMTALFVIIFVEQWESSKNHIPALLGLGIPLACLLIFGSEYFLIPALIILTAVLFLMRNRFERLRAEE